MAADLHFPCLCLVTDRHRCEGRPVDEVVARAVEGGANLVQLREKDLPARRLLALARRLRDVTAGRALLFVNDRVDVALACGADGVQLGEEGMPLKAARQVSGGRLLLGRSVHSVEGAMAAEANGADLLVVGTIFPTGSHPGATTAGVDLLKSVAVQVSIPFLAIGGVKANNIESVIEAGASGVAVITAIARSHEPTRVSREMMEAMQTVWATRPERRAARQP